MLRSVLLLLLLPASCAATATCDPTSGDTCINDRTGDYQSHLQNRVKMEMEGTEEMETENNEAGQTMGTCDANSDANCCFTAKGVAFAKSKKAVPDGTVAGICAAGAKDVSPNAKAWADYVTAGYVETCSADQCTNPNPEGLKPEKGPGKCELFKCTGTFKQKAAVAKDALCTTKDECLFNCCDVDINAAKNERSEILSFATIMVLKNATKISADIDVAEDLAKKKIKSHDFTQDKKLLNDAWAGLCKVMKHVQGGEAACPQADITKMKSCIHKATCVIEEGVDYKALETDKDQLKAYTLLVELYDKFETVAWDKMLAVLKEEKVKVKGADYVSPGELACSGLKELRKHATWEKVKKLSFMEADSEEQEAAYRVSAALVAAAETTHAVLDSHRANSSVEETVAALHRAWQVPCEMLDCDHTNYWDLLGASHRHSLALIESGASAHHMRVHVGVRARMEHRMQVFIGTDGMNFANRIIRTEGTRTEALAKAYADALYEATQRMWLEHPKKYGVSSLLLSLAPREELHEHAKTDLQKLAVQAIMDDNLIMASKKATLHHMMEERGLSVSSDEEPDVDEEEEVPFSLLEGSSRLDRSLGRKGFVKFFESVGKGIVSVGKAIGGAIVTGFTALGQAIVTVATAIGNVIKAFVDFVLSLFKCFGFGVVGEQGYAVVFSPIGVTGGAFKFSLKASVSDAMTGIIQGQPARAIGVAINLGLAVGVVMTKGVSLGVGIAAGIACGVNSATGGSCVFSIGVGITASAAISDPTCLFGAWLFNPVFECTKSFGLTLKILCCNINLITGCSSCGSGCSDSSTGSSSGDASNAVNKRGSGAIQCSENLSGNGAGYRGCQTVTLGGRTCQKWSAQSPHSHEQCRQETQTLSGASSKGSLIKAVHGKCLDAPQRNRAGGVVYMWDCNANNHNQQWIYTSSANGQIKMYHGKCLDASQRNRNGGTVHIWDCSTNNHNQMWSVAGQQVKATHGKCLDASQRNRNAGKVHMWDCSQNNHNQMWDVKGTTGKVWCEGTSDTNKGLGDHNLCRNPNGHPTIWCYTTDEHKRWENCGLQAGTGVSGSNKQIKATHGKCLDASQRNRNGGLVHMWDCSRNNHNQQWQVTTSSRQIKAQHGKCLDASQRNRTGGTVHMWDCSTNNHNQQWTISGQQIKATHGKCLDASQRNRTGGKVHMWDCNTGNHNQQWTIS